MLGSDLPSLRNPAPAIGVIAATESEFDPLHPPDQPASESATPRHGRSCFAADRPLVALHQDQEASTQRQERLHTKDRQGYAIREYKRIVQGGSAAATELLCYGTSVVVERLEEKGQGFRT